FDFILLDPPWPNRSAERSKSTYDTLPNHKDLLLLPLESSLRENGIVGVWITNKPKWRQFVHQRLFPKWGLEYAGEWIWLKVTKSGEPIFNLDSVMRKPYELLLFGRKPPAKKQLGRFPSPIVEGSRGSSPQPRVSRMPQKVIVAVPDLHSRKPCLKDVIKSFLPMNYTACEIFGRHLVEGWFTWGDESIKFNA
ncbi:MT-A70, partial [Terfezia claveryi]